MNIVTINSLDELSKRKRELKKEMIACEEEIEYKVYDLTHPFATLFSNSESDDDEIYEDEMPQQLKKGYKFISNAMRLVQIFRIGKDIYSDFRKK